MPSPNTDCMCLTLDRVELERAFAGEVADAGIGQRLTEMRPTLVSDQSLFVAPEHADRMARIIRAIEETARLPGYRAAVLQSAPAIARFAPGPIGVFMSYDFHLGPEGPKLIEINTNAGGALINALLAKAQKACCAKAGFVATGAMGMQDYEDRFIASFHEEWRRQGRDAALSTIAIVDVDPQGQYLYPEFLLFQNLFERHGLTAVISPPEAFEHRDDVLWCGTVPIDIVYNRVTDFTLDEPDSAALRSAYLAGDVVLTPNPWAHAMFADKRNLIRLTDPHILRSWGMSAEQTDVLIDGIAQTIPVSADQADSLWAKRDALFFKPVAGFGGRAAYRGDKLTRRVWDSILQGGYIAQALIPPGSRTLLVDGRLEVMKADLRNYTYNGEILLLAARLYQGQTTNFRTPGGGFAPVLLSDSLCATESGSSNCC
jgi:hypothetical protein